VLSSQAWTDSAGNLVISGEIVNNTPDKYRLNQLTATYKNGSGATLTTANAWADVNVMPAHSRSPFRISIAKPTGYASYTVAVTYSQKTTDTVVQNFPVSSTTQGFTNGPWFKGTFTNANGFNVNWVKTATALFDTWGTVINTSVDWTSPTSLAAGATGNYNVTFTQHYSGWNRASVVIQATQATSGTTAPQ
jgi:hypothetical protein